MTSSLDNQTGTGFEPTLCDGDTTNNQWFEDGVCMLDTMTKDQVIYTISRNPSARDDLRRVTSCTEILNLLDQVHLLPSVEEEDELQQRFNKGDLLPFYNIFRGNLNNQ
jgi:hypothetical protein